jgi:hypothetical protein
MGIRAKLIQRLGSTASYSATGYDRIAKMAHHALKLAVVCGLWLPTWACAQDVLEPQERTQSRFLDGLEWQMMASGFYLFNANRVSGPYNELNYPYTSYMGFGLNFVGGDVSYTGKNSRSPSAYAGEAALLN